MTFDLESADTPTWLDTVKHQILECSLFCGAAGLNGTSIKSSQASFSYLYVGTEQSSVHQESV